MILDILGQFEDSITNTHVSLERKLVKKAQRFPHNLNACVHYTQPCHPLEGAYVFGVSKDSVM